MQSTAGAAYIGVTDGGSTRTLELPFAINGVSAVPEPDTYTLIVAGALGVFGAARARRAKQA